MTTDAQAELLAMLDRENIRDCIARVARGEDRRDATALRGCYWPDAATDFGIFRGPFEDYLAWVVPGSPAVLVTQHVLGQALIVLTGERAKAETHVLSYHRVNMGEAVRDICIGGRYLDQMERRGGEWRIAHRMMIYDWVQDWGVSADWSQGLMGTPFSSDQFTGRAVGDHSEAFFAKPARP